MPAVISSTTRSSVAPASAELLRALPQKPPGDHLRIIAVTALFPFRELLGHVTFSWVLYAAIVTLAILNVAPFRMPKLVGFWY